MKNKIIITAALFFLLALHSTVMAQAIPDPSVFLGNAGEIFEQDTSYNGIQYDAYIYKRSSSEQEFLNDYINAVINAGYSVGKTQVEGYPALKITEQYHENDALLLYDYQGSMLLLVPKDMFFVLQKPDTSPVIDPLYLDMISYVRKYLGTTKSKALGSDEIGYGLSQAFEEAYYDQKKAQDFGYCFIDIDGDGTDEMIFANVGNDIYSHGSEIYDLFTIKNGTLVHLASGYYRAKYHLCSDGEIVFNGSNSAFDAQTVYYSLKNGELVLGQNIYFISNSDMNGGNYYVSNISDDYVFWNSPEHPSDARIISESDAQSVFDNCREVYLDLQPFFE